MNIKTINQLETTQSVEGMYGVACDEEGNTKKYDIKDSPFEKGEAENSAVLKGGDNEVISEGGVALGKNNVVGLKGWYYKAVQFGTSDPVMFIYLTKVKQFPKVITSASEISSEKDVMFDLPVGSKISIVNAIQYYDVCVLEESQIEQYGRIKVRFSNKPFDSIQGGTLEELAKQEAYSIYCFDYPDRGATNIGTHADVSGVYNKCLNIGASSCGGYNKSYGKYSHTEGRSNQAGYAAHAEGSENIASGEQSNAEGYQTIASGYYAHSEGIKTVAKGNASHAEGKSCTSSGIGSHAEGNWTITFGDFSHSEGVHTVTSNAGEHTQGKYNVSNVSTIHSVGIGTSNNDKKNAHEIMLDGKHYIYGIGGYDGTNPTTAKSLQDVINEILSKIG